MISDTSPREDIGLFVEQFCDMLRPLSEGDGLIKEAIRTAEAFTEQELPNSALCGTEARNMPTTDWLPLAIAEARRQDTQNTFDGLLSALERLAPMLRWELGYDPRDVERDFAERFAFTEIVGLKGAATSSRFAAGVTLMAPNTFYEWHAHPAVEIYTCLSEGTRWGLDHHPLARREFGSVIVHPSMASHAMASANHPFLAVWIWSGDTQTPAAMVS